jgi:7-carboxy-7-deazaguanine synthase
VDSLVINEIYLSVQGESTFAGLPCVFIRTTGCNLRCSYCDTAYAFTEGQRRSLDEVRTEVNRLAVPYKANGGLPRRLGEDASPYPVVELTGGEPLLHKGVLPLMQALCDDGYTVLIETSGAHDISGIDPRVRRIMDLKCPSSGEADKNRWENIALLKGTDEVKFVIGTVEDYVWSKNVLDKYDLARICPVLFSWVSPLTREQQDPTLKKVPQPQTPLSRKELVERIITDALPVRFQVQMHKVIWSPDQRGV